MFGVSRIKWPAAVAIASAIALVVPGTAAAFQWKPGWPKDPTRSYYWRSNVRLLPGNGATLTMHIKRGMVTSSGAAVGSVMQRPRRGAWCVRARLSWTALRGTVPTLWYRPASWLHKRPEFDFVEGLRTPDSFDVARHPSYHRSIGYYDTVWGSGRAAIYTAKLWRSSVDAYINGVLVSSGRLWWPASGYLPVISYWAFNSRVDRETAWSTHRLARSYSGRTTFRVHSYSQRRC